MAAFSPINHYKIDGHDVKDPHTNEYSGICFNTALVTAAFVTQDWDHDDFDLMLLHLDDIRTRISYKKKEDAFSDLEKLRSIM